MAGAAALAILLQEAAAGGLEAEGEELAAVRAFTEGWAGLAEEAEEEGVRM